MDWLEEFIDLIILLLFFVFAPLLRRLQRARADRQQAEKAHQAQQGEELDEEIEDEEDDAEARYLASDEGEPLDSDTPDVGARSTAPRETPRPIADPAEELRRMLERYLKQAKAEWAAKKRGETSSGEVREHGRLEDPRQVPPRPPMAVVRPDDSHRHTPDDHSHHVRRFAHAKGDGAEPMSTRDAALARKPFNRPPALGQRTAPRQDPWLVRDALIMGDILWGEGATGPQRSLVHRRLPAGNAEIPRRPHP